MSLEFLSAFKFLKKETFLHRLDPRTKLLLAITYTVNAFLFQELVPLLFVLITLLPIILLSQLFKKWVKSVKGMSFLYIFIIILNTLFINNYGLSFAIAMILRISIMISAFSLFFLTVDPNDLALSLISMKIPYEYAFSFSLAFRFVPTVAIETQNIIDAQQSRGYEMQKKGIFNQIKNLIPLLVPLIISSIKRAFNVAEALESRSFGNKKDRTYYYTIKFSLKDWIFSLYLISLTTFLIYIRINFILMPLWFKWSLPL
ncbi:MAG: energy-coupling factor transporter transmembrane component T family protein [Candidatus Hermodarchaeota archaeon]